jgi:hypothetical protein
MTMPGRFIVEAMAQGDHGAVKLQILRATEPSATELASYRARVSAQYRVEYKEWANHPTATFRPVTA